MTKLSKRSKFLIIVFSLIVSACVYAACCTSFYSKMTPWQLEQKIDPDAKTGLTKLKAHIDSATIAGIAFCATAILSFAALKKFAKI